MVPAAVVSETPTGPSVTALSSDQSAAETLAESMIAGTSRSQLTGGSFVTVPPTFGTNGVANGLGGFPTNGPDAALLTTGDAALALPGNVNANRDSGGTAVRGDTARDVTVLKLSLNAPGTANCLSFDFRFLSEEYPEYVGTAYNDGFIAELDNSTWTTAGSSIFAPDNFAFDPSGNVVSINTTGALTMTAEAAAGTNYDGATPMLRASTPVLPGAHSLYLSVFDQGDEFYDSAALVDNIQFTHVTSPGDCREGATADPVHRPVIFIPGITGSTLLDGDLNEAFPRALQTAASPSDSHYDQLALKGDGLSPCDGCSIRVGDVLRSIPGSDVYGSTIDLIKKAGYTLSDFGVPEPGVDFYLFPFDWRKSPKYNADNLLALIDSIRKATGEPKVNIIAHSQGGLVTEAALADPASVGKINRVVTLGTPYLGAAKLLAELQYKEPCQSELLGQCVINKDEIAKLLRNFPGALALMPSRSYTTAVSPPVYRNFDADGDGSSDGRLSWEQLRSLLSDQNLPLIDQAWAWHDQVDGWHPADPQVGLTRVVGSGKSTITSINDERKEDCSGWLWWRDCHLVPSSSFNYGSGDETVPLHAADLVNPATGVDLRGPTRVVYAPGITHGGLPQRDFVIAYALQFLEGEGPAVSSTTAAPAAYATPAGTGPDGGVHLVGDTAADEVPSDALTDTPTLLSGTEVLITGPVTGSLTDSAGRRTGATDPVLGIERQEIPGSVYNAGPQVASTFLVTSGGTGRWTVTTDGDVRVRLRSYADDQVTTTVTYPPVVVRNGAVLSLADVTVPLGAPSVLRVDDNADGVVDRTIAPRPAVTGTAASDSIAPRTTATITQYRGDDGTTHNRITLSATDNAGGSGVDRIEYGFEAGGRGGVYSGPLDTTSNGVLFVRAVDRAGNVEAPYLRVELSDDYPDSRTSVTTFLEPHQNLSGLLGNPGDEDWFGIHLDTPGRLQAQLIGLSHDYDLYLYDTSGALIASSQRRGNDSERITTTVGTGNYYLRVAGYQGAWSGTKGYRLNVTRPGN